MTDWTAVSCHLNMNTRSVPWSRSPSGVASPWHGPARMRKARTPWTSRYCGAATPKTWRGVLIAAARREGTEWGVRINVGFRGQHWSWRQSDIDLTAALTEGMQQVVDQVAAVQTIAASDLGIWQQDLTVRGLSGATYYRRCLSYLQGISLVDRVEVISAQPGAVTFRLGLSAMPSYLEVILDSGQVLQRAEEGDGWLWAGALPDDG